jgi:uncharacterized protein (TIGR03435 family)
MVRIAPATIFLVIVAAHLGAQSRGEVTAGAPPTFTVASIKPSPPPTGGPMRMTAGPRGGGQWLAANVPLAFILMNAYPDFSRPGQIVGGPEWIHTQAFDVNAKADGNPPVDVIMAMVKQLLADRFKLKVHSEAREVDAYALVLARPDGRLGPNIKKAAVDCAARAEEMKRARAAGAALQPPTPPTPGQRPECGMSSTESNGVRRVLIGGNPIGAITMAIQSTVGRQVVDRTGLTGAFDIDLEFSGAGQLTTNADQPNALPSVFTALQEQLGLKLESRKEKMDVLVIDSVEMPTPD